MESTHHYTKAVTIKSYIVFLILILYTPSLYCIPPPYQRLLWNYKKADISDIQKALQLVNLDRLLDDKNVDSQVLLLNDIILIFSGTLYQIDTLLVMTKILFG